MTRRAPSLRGRRYPAAVIAHAVWLDFRFPLSLRIVEEMLAERGIVVSLSAPGTQGGGDDTVAPAFRRAGLKARSQPLDGQPEPS